jgi:hypothetical protein
VRARHVARLGFLAAGLAAALLAIACARRAESVDSAFDRASIAYVKLALALGERDSDSLDSYRGPASWRADAHAEHASFAQVRERAKALARSLAEIKPGDGGERAPRRAFLLGQLQAIASRIDVVQGARPTFDEEARVLFGLDPRDAGARPDAGAAEPSGAGRPAAIRAALDRRLPGHGDLAARLDAFDRQFQVPADRIATVFARALDGCRAVTRDHVALPDRERVSVEYASDLPWAAFTRYQGQFVSRIVVNTAQPLTVDRLLELACHEGYPGHHTINVLLESRYAERRPDLLVQLLFSPQSALHEAAASLAPELAFSDAARTAFERDELFPRAGLDPAGAARHVAVARLVDGLHGVVGDVVRRYLDGALDFPRAAAALECEALMRSAAPTLKFVNQFRSYAATYTDARDRLAPAVAGSWDAYLRAATAPAQALPAPAAGLR